MKNFLFFLLFTTLLFSSCAVIKQESMVGKFEGFTPQMGSFIRASQMKLSLNSDGTFNLYWNHADYTGKWSFLDKKNILLELDEMADPQFYLRSGIISAEEVKIKVISSNKLRYLGRSFTAILLKVD